MSAYPFIYLVRHGQTVWNLERRLQGQRDSPLTALGIRQAEAVGQLLRTLLGHRPDVPLLTSPLGRAWQTAVIVAEALGRAPGDLYQDARLKERNFGIFEGKTAAELKRDQPEVFARLSLDDPADRIPEVESLMEMEARVGAWLAAQLPARPRVVICHGITSQVLRGLYLGLPVDQWLSLPKTQGVVFRLSEGRLETLTPEG